MSPDFRLPLPNLKLNGHGAPLGVPHPDEAKMKDLRPMMMKVFVMKPPLMSGMMPLVSRPQMSTLLILGGINGKTMDGLPGIGIGGLLLAGMRKAGFSQHPISGTPTSIVKVHYKSSNTMFDDACRPRKPSWTGLPSSDSLGHAALDL